MQNAQYEEEDFSAYIDYHTGGRPFPPWAENLFSDLKLTPGRSLDVGCADGAVVERLGQSGFDAHGLDLDRKSISAAIANRNLKKMYTGTVTDFARSFDKLVGYFDLISFFEVLEHQADPKQFIQTIKSLAKPGAKIVGSVPNRNRFLVSLDRLLSDGDHPPHHFLWFSTEALRNFLELSGIHNVSVYYAQRPSLTNRHLSSRKIVNRIIFKNQNIDKGVMRTISTVAAWPIALILSIGDAIKPPHLFFYGEIPPHDIAPSRRSIE